jgi:ribosomal protein L37AE/L43A
MSMDKYGVDEDTTEKNALPKTDAENVCPKCNNNTEKHGNVKICPKCGSEPFEGEEDTVS